MEFARVLGISGSLNLFRELDCSLIFLVVKCRFIIDGGLLIV